MNRTFLLLEFGIRYFPLLFFYYLVHHNIHNTAGSRRRKNERMRCFVVLAPINSQFTNITS